VWRLFKYISSVLKNGSLGLELTSKCHLVLEKCLLNWAAPTNFKKMIMQYNFDFLGYFFEVIFMPRLERKVQV
jgi:hypothetical protein